MCSCSTIGRASLVIEAEAEEEGAGVVEAEGVEAEWAEGVEAEWAEAEGTEADVTGTTWPLH